MKKFYILALFVVASICAYANGPRAIGANLGYDLGLNYQHSFGVSNMLDANAYCSLWYAGGVAATVTYDWINPGGNDVPWTQAGDWNWYVGVGGAGGVGNLFAHDYFTGFIGAAGHIGIEYVINHFAVSLDARPTVGAYFGQDSENKRYVGFNPIGLANGLSLGLKYSF